MDNHPVLTEHQFVGYNDYYEVPVGQIHVHDGYSMNVEVLSGEGSIYYVAGLDYYMGDYQVTRMIGGGVIGHSIGDYLNFTIMSDTAHKELGFWTAYTAERLEESPLSVAALGRDGEVLGTFNYLDNMEHIPYYQAAFRGFRFDDGTDIYGLRFTGVNILLFDTPAGNVTSAVPEAATWAMMIAGFGMVGRAMRRHRREAVAA